MENQCNTCGGFENLGKCSHCVTVVCAHCKLRHEPYCKKNQEILKAGGGATIANVPQAPHRHGHETPEDVRTPAPERVLSKPAILGAPYDLSKPSLTPEQVLEARLTAPLLFTVTAAPETSHHRRIVDTPIEPVDQAIAPVALDADAELAAMKDLLNEK